MATFEKRSEMPVPRQALFDFHARRGAIERLIPPWQTARIVERSDHIRDGARVTLELQAGPLWKRWTAEHFDYIDGRQFRDRQVRGPMRSWTHTHRFEDGQAPGTSVLIDHVEYAPPMAALSGGFVRREIERMFAFRHARTRNDLSRHAEATTPLTVAVSGASGAIGSKLAAFLTTAGHEVRRLVRTHLRDRAAAPDIQYDTQVGSIDRERLAPCDAVVHLAGKNIAVRWTRRAWREIESSRVEATRSLCEMIAAMPIRPRVLVCASAVGFYGDRGEEELTEASPPGTGRLAELCQAWEAATQPARDAGIRVVNLRIGVVVSAGSGAVKKLLTPTRLGLAGPIGDGRQWMPWVAMDDVVALIDRAIRDETWRGPINAVTGSVRQREFARTLARVLNRPAIVPTPRLAISATFGAMGREVLFASANVRPTLTERGFAPTFATLEAALRFELGR